MPELRARDFSGGDVFHEVVDGDGAATFEPSVGVAQGGVDVVAQAGFGYGAAARGQEVASADGCWWAVVELTLFAAEFALKDFKGYGHQARVRDPGAVVAVVGFELFISADFGEGLGISLGVVLDGYLRCHAAHGKSTATMASLHE